ncbi:hypothetical protein RMSM_02536 [Rhodopirellula maiorica SM1]|uniref:Uncharacterized protein n=1 Tax=Rhodopirellula maiorica SM1 TaxID=1265738 RepID=M5S2U1_9BACT|nr:hypothetical protein [Rhodopirellula maiorica]EMI20504.1 hypothetical protein RMSM_02536 [Rhodopirellula maiorica SM1]
MERANEQTIKSRVLKGRCILDGCDSPLGSRGLCDHHRQKWYRTLKEEATEDKRNAFEENSIKLGLILRSGEQDEWIREQSNPFRAAKALS